MAPGPKRPRRRSFLWFCGTLIVACAGSLAFVYSRSPEYRATALIEIVPAADIAADAKTAPNTASVLAEIKALTGRATVKAALGALKMKPELGSDAAGSAQAMLSATPDAGGIVELSAHGADPDFAAQLVNAVIAAYRDSAVRSFSARTAGSIARARAQAEEADADFAAKKEALDALRGDNDMAALQDKESAIAATIAGLDDAYSAATRQRSEARARRKALADAAAGGQSIVRAQDQPALDDLEHQIAPLRAQLEDLERRFTPAYLALDATTRTLRARITDLENRLQAERADSGKAAIQDADADLANADAEVSRLASALEENRRAADALSGRLSVFKAAQEALEKSQTAARAAHDHLTGLEENARDGGPKIQVLQAAAPSRVPARPVYARDAGIAVAGSLFFALFSTWFGGLVARRRAANDIGYHGIGTPALEGYVPPLLPRRGSVPRLVEIEGRTLRELRSDEIAALMKSAPDDVRLIVAALLMGMDAADIVALTWDEERAVTIGGDPKRRVRIEEGLLARLRGGAPSEPNTALLRDETGAPLTEDGIDGLLASAAEIAGLDHPREVTAAALRRTYSLFVKRRRRPQSRAA